MQRLLIANRGEIACRIIRTAKRMHIDTVAVFSTIDAAALHVECADQAVNLNGESAADTYLDIEKLINAAQQTGADAIHPGYGFLSENADFAAACEAAGITFVGPPTSAIKAMGSKSTAKRIMAAAGVPLLPGYHGDAQDAATLEHEASKIGYPVLLKAAAGGGGKGMRIVEDQGVFADALAAAKREATNSFGDDKMLVEKYLIAPRHIELQIFADQHDQQVHLFDRDCSIQRRHQKIIEEAPAPDVPDTVRKAMANAAIDAAKAISYVGAGTVEFLLDTNNQFYFMEMNTRLQVEHPVSELITGVDLVEWQIRVARGEPLPRTQDEIKSSGHAVECRLYAENPDNDFLPDSGRIDALRFPTNTTTTRVDTGVRDGDTISVFYDPMIAKVVTWQPNRPDAIAAMQVALSETQLIGPENNIDYLMRILATESFIGGVPDTSFIPRHADALKARAASNSHWVAAAVHQYGLDLVSSGKDSLWQQFSGWRANQENLVPYTLQHGECTKRVTLIIEGHQPVRARLDNTTAVISLVDAGQATIQIDSVSERFHVVSADSRTLVSDRNGHRLFNLAPMDIGETGDAQGDGIVRAPMTGRVVSVLKSVGELVNANDKLLIIEAMKMEHTIRATGAGTIESCAVNVGDLVDGQQIIMTVALQGDQ